MPTACQAQAWIIWGPLQLTDSIPYASRCHRCSTFDQDILSPSLLPPRRHTRSLGKSPSRMYDVAVKPLCRFQAVPAAKVGPAPEAVFLARLLPCSARPPPSNPALDGVLICGTRPVTVRARRVVTESSIIAIDTHVVCAAVTCSTPAAATLYIYELDCPCPRLLMSWMRHVSCLIIDYTWIHRLYLVLALASSVS